MTVLDDFEAFCTTVKKIATGEKSFEQLAEDVFEAPQDKTRPAKDAPPATANGTPKLELVKG